jgi:hypothetical protein
LLLVVGQRRGCEWRAGLFGLHELAGDRTRAIDGVEQVLQHMQHVLDQGCPVIATANPCNVLI